MSPPKKVPPSPSTDRVMHVSFGLIALGAIAIILIGMAGGFIANQLWRSPLPPLTNEAARFVTTIQEVTISPNKAAADIAERNNKSVFLLSRDISAAPSATGFAITNDGVVVSAADLNGSVLIAFDFEGRALPLTRIGRDEIYGLTYYRLPNNVVVPLDLRQTDPPVGYELLAMSRNLTTYQSRVSPFLVGEYSVPANAAPALQRIIRSTTTTLETATGSPLVDEEGKVAGIVQATSGTAYPVSHLQASLARTTSNQREADPFDRIGLAVNYSFTPSTLENSAKFQVTVTAVAPDSSAQAAGVKRGDIITAINDTPVSWEQPIATQLSASLPLTVALLRGSETLTVTLAANPTPTPIPQ